MGGGAGTEEHVTIVHPMYPNRTQERELTGMLETLRGLYNRFLSDAIADMAEGRPLRGRFDMHKEITVLRRDDAALRSIPVATLRDAADRAHQAATRFRKLSVRSGELRLPRFKGPGRYRSLSFRPETFRIDGRRLVLSKGMRIRGGNPHRPKGGAPVTVRAVRHGRGRWYLHVTYVRELVRRGEDDLDRPRHPEGYDMGLVDIITDTAGNRIAAPDFYAVEERRIANLQRRLSGLEEGTPGWEKAKVKLARIHAKVERRRSGYLDSVAGEMVRGHSVVAIEDLGIRRMIERDDAGVVRRRRYTEVAWRRLVTKVERKAERADVVLVKVNPAFTTRRCSYCGHVREPIPLSTRLFTCPVCGLEMDRDRNAALNILGSGMGTLRQASAEPSGSPRRHRDGGGQPTLNPRESLLLWSPADEASINRSGPMDEPFGKRACLLS